MKLQEMLDSVAAKWTPDNVQRIYSGLDHCCRCGCGGKYYDRGSVGFKRILSKLIAGKVEPYPAGTQRYVTGGGHKEWIIEEGLDFHGDYLNIPIAETSNKCYCLYFEW